MLPSISLFSAQRTHTFPQGILGPSQRIVTSCVPVHASRRSTIVSTEHNYTVVVHSSGFKSVHHLIKWKMRVLSRQYLVTSQRVLSTLLILVVYRTRISINLACVTGRIVCAKFERQNREGNGEKQFETPLVVTPLMAAPPPKLYLRIQYRQLRRIASVC